MDFYQLFINRFFCRLLNFFINRQPQICSGNRFLFANDLYRFTPGINFYLFTTIDAAQLLVINLFKAKFPDNVPRAITIRLSLFKLIITNFADIAEYMAM